MDIQPAEPDLSLFADFTIDPSPALPAPAPFISGDPESERAAAYSPQGLPLNTPIAAVCEEKETNTFKKLGLETLADFMDYYPNRWVERGVQEDIENLLDGMDATVGYTPTKGWLKTMNNGYRKMYVMDGFTDHGRPLRLNFFNAYQAKSEVKVGEHYHLTGTLKTFGGVRSMTVKEYESDFDLLRRPVRSVYPAKPSVGATAEWIEKHNIDILAAAGEVEDHLPADIRAHRGLMLLDTAKRTMHLPDSVQAAEAAKYRLTYDEALATQLVLVARRHGANSAVSRSYPLVPGGLRDTFDAGLPYELTDGQKDAGAMIEKSLNASTPMNALTLGDVGSGKTTVANRALLQVVDAGAQGAFIAPTEVLAKQHYKGLTEDLAGLNIRIGLLVGTMSPAEKKPVLAGLADGTIDLVVGTHAVLSPTVQFKQLGLAVIDEQHRFGVEQRDALRHRSEITPHLLVMTATPIPRTVAMTVYGDLDVYELKGVPAGRKPVKTFVSPLYKPAWTERIWAVMNDQVQHGHQVFVVASLIEKAGAGGANTKLTFTGFTPGSPVTITLCDENGAEVQIVDEKGTAKKSARPKANAAGVATLTLRTGAYEPGQYTATANAKGTVAQQQILNISESAETSGENVTDTNPDTDENGALARPAAATVYELAEQVRTHIPAARVGIMHGKLPDEEKTAVMDAFAAGQIDILVSTTVIEVGVNVPNSTIMCIWDADRFGAAQLHQLRGRVGRGKYDGLCLLVTSAPPEHPSLERLEAVASTNDGYAIAQIDLQQRKEGDILGTGQAGRSRMKLLDLNAAARVISKARQDAVQIISSDPALRAHPQLSQWLSSMLSEEERAAIMRG